MAFEEYIQSGGKLLRCGYTTGTCAALAAAGAARLLLLGAPPETLSLVTPKGIKVDLAPEYCRFQGESALCAVAKDGGQDVDATHGALIQAEVQRTEAPGIQIHGGDGVGRVTKPGLDQPVGEAAINRVPREMMTNALLAVCRAADYAGGLSVTISVPGGEEIARKTFNPHLGVVGGISILGTSGIVEPMSLKALMDSITVELRQQYALGARRVILTPGNYGTGYIRDAGLDHLGVPIVKCSNFIGETIDAAGALGFREVLLVGHVGKLVKLAGGIMDTHSRVADGRAELFTAHAALCGADRATCQSLMDSATSDACIEILDGAGLRAAVMDRLLKAIQTRLDRRGGNDMVLGSELFSSVFGYLGRTSGAERLLTAWKDQLSKVNRETRKTRKK